MDIRKELTGDRLDVAVVGRLDTTTAPQLDAALKEALPGIVNDYGGDPTKSGGWRYNNDGSLTERYALLREQMLYDEGIWWKRLSNSPSGEEN